MLEAEIVIGRYRVLACADGLPESYYSCRAHAELVLIVPETATVFVGAGERLLAYRLEPHPERLWMDQAFFGFWSWARFDGVVLMSSELELTAWTIDGRKLWSTSVEPPWTFDVADGRVALDVMGTKSSFDLTTGPKGN